MEHVNESILSEEIKEHQKEARIDHMTYLPGMEALKSDITKQVIEAMEAYDYDSYTAEDVRRALAKRNRTPEWRSVQKWKKKITLAIPSAFLHRFILPTTVKITVFIVDSTAITVSAGQN